MALIGVHVERPVRPGALVRGDEVTVVLPSHVNLRLTVPVPWQTVEQLRNTVCLRQIH